LASFQILDGAFNDQNGAGQARLFPLTEEVSIWAFPIFGGSIHLPFSNFTYLQAFDSNGTLIGQTSFKPGSGD
jgi:hypothetical protein